MSDLFPRLQPSANSEFGSIPSGDIVLNEVANNAMPRVQGAASWAHWVHLHDADAFIETEVKTTTTTADTAKITMQATVEPVPPTADVVDFPAAYTEPQDFLTASREAVQQAYIDNLTNTASQDDYGLTA